MATQLGYLDDEQRTVEEGLKRGASENLLVGWLFEQRKRKQLLNSTASRAEALTAKESLRRLLQPQIVQYQNMVAAEFNSLTIRFNTSGSGRTDLEHYSLMRPLYYGLGYTNPVADIFSKIHGFHFLGKAVPGGVHSVLADVLSLVPGILNAVAPGLSDRVASCILYQDGGFVPRYIANTEVLSNHAFGLAIDIDPPFNPHVVNGEVIAVLNEVVSKRKGINFNFDERYTARSLANRLLTDEGRTKVTFLYARMASDAVKDWLTENLDSYEQCLAQITAGRNAKKGSNEETLSANAEEEIASDPDFQWIARITGRGKRADDYASLQTLHTWARYGIQTVPVELPLAIEQAMRIKGFPKNQKNHPWGQEWERSKDAMHFELVYSEAIPPDSQKRPLIDLFPMYPFLEMLGEADRPIGPLVVPPPPVPRASR